MINPGAEGRWFSALPGCAPASRVRGRWAVGPPGFNIGQPRAHGTRKLNIPPEAAKRLPTPGCRAAGDKYSSGDAPTPELYSPQALRPCGLDNSPETHPSACWMAWRACPGKTGKEREGKTREGEGRAGVCGRKGTESVWKRRVRTAVGANLAALRPGVCRLSRKADCRANIQGWGATWAF